MNCPYFMIPLESTRYLFMCFLCNLVKSRYVIEDCNYEETIVKAKKVLVRNYEYIYIVHII